MSSVLVPTPLQPCRVGVLEAEQNAEAGLLT